MMTSSTYLQASTERQRSCRSMMGRCSPRRSDTSSSVCSPTSRKSPCSLAFCTTCVTSAKSFRQRLYLAESAVTQWVWSQPCTSPIDIPCSLDVCIKCVCTMCDRKGGQRGGGEFGPDANWSAVSLSTKPALAQFLTVGNPNKDKEAM